MAQQVKAPVTRTWQPDNVKCKTVDSICGRNQHLCCCYALEKNWILGIVRQSCSHATEDWGGSEL